MGLSLIQALLPLLASMCRRKWLASHQGDGRVSMTPMEISLALWLKILTWIPRRMPTAGISHLIMISKPVLIFLIRRMSYSLQ